MPAGRQIDHGCSGALQLLDCHLADDDGVLCGHRQWTLGKKLIGLNLFQASVFILYISMGTVDGGAAPILRSGVDVFSNPLPHVLILTAIVVGVATTALGLALVVRIKEAYGSAEEEDIHRQDDSL